MSISAGSARRNVKDQFEEQTERTPDALAVVCGSERLTYEALNAWGNRLAFALRERGAGPGDVVAACTRRSGAMAAAVLAVAKSGAAYLPLDPEHPFDRLRFMIEDAGARLVLTQSDMADALAPGACGAPTVLADGPALASFPSTNPESTATADDLMYVIYTSGSTGRPKGVAMHQAPQVDLADWSGRHYAGRPIALQYFPISSDVGSYELLTTWRSGGCVVIAADAERYDIASLARLVREHSVTRLMLPAAVLEQFAHHANRRPEDVASVREIATTGDRLVITRAMREMFDRLPGVFLENQYGSTEVNVVTTVRLAGPAGDWPEVPSIGTPMGRARIYVLDTALAPVPVGVPGEIFVGGDPVARGYIGRSALTAERFLPDPFVNAAGSRMYRMGDVGRWLPDGTLECLGRTDFQIKINGYRVEPAEIEFLLRNRPDVDEAAVVATEGSDSRLIAYVAPVGAPPEPRELRDYLSSLLPGYMIPRVFVMLDRLPLTRTGKVDRRQLPAPGPGDPEITAPRNEMEKVIAEVMANVLSLDEVGVHQDFFELGGHSLLIMPVIQRLGDKFGVDLPLRALFDSPTVAELAVSVATADKRTAPALTRRARKT
jgi:amino acid adenylation domain-containing protein